MSIYEDVKVAARARTARINSLWWWLFSKSSSDPVKNAAVSSGTRAGSSLWRFLTRSPKLIRRGVQGIVVYVTTYVAEKFLDKAHEEFPNNQFVAKMDAVAHGAMKVENFLITGATSMAKDLYDSIPAEAAPPKASELASIPTPLLPSELTKAVTPENPKEMASMPTPDVIKAGTEESNNAITIPQVSAEELKPPSGMPIPLTPPNPPAASIAPVVQTPTREASFMPVETGQRNRANLNAVLMPPVQPGPTVPAIAPDGFPINGGYDPATEITWGAYGRPIATRIINNKGAMPLSDRYSPKQ